MPDYLYVGTYPDPAHPATGLYVLSLDPSSGDPRPAGMTPTPTPSWVALHPGGRYLYAMNEVPEFAGRPGGGVSGFAIDPATGLLSPVNAQPTRGALPCHGVVDKTGRYLLVATYRGGTVEMFPIDGDGRLGPACDRHQHEGSSTRPDRQDEAHAHAVTLDPDNRFALVADLGTDTVVHYELDLDRGRLVPHPERDAHIVPGSGPRHLAFHPGARFAYLISELSATVTAFAYQAATGELRELQSVSTLPDGFVGYRATAEVAVHPSGRFLYASNRSDGSGGEPPECGVDSIVWFEIDAGSGRLRRRGRAGSGGMLPRSFVISADGTRLYVANQHSGTIARFLIDAETGDLTPDGDRAPVPAPVGLQFAAASLFSSSSSGSRPNRSALE
jgi:6-phosphogluconolactonase